MDAKYGNKLDLSKALENKDECINLIRQNYGYNGPIETGGFYIMPEGTIIKSVNHADIDKFLVRKGFIKGEVIEYGDGSQFMDALNCVRIRRRGGRDSWILPYIILPKLQLTQTQYDILKKWIDFVLDKTGNLLLTSQEGNNKHYNHREYTSDDIINDIKYYYRTSILEKIVENEFESTHKDLLMDDIDDTDYLLEKTIENYDNMWKDIN